jgi:3',5'-cyclic AMP phosphodiesterase CpdA
MTRREALLAGAAALLAASCASGRPTSRPGGSTLASTWGDPDGTGVLRAMPGESLVPRTELGPPAPATRPLATLAHITDAHVLDASSPARVPFLDRLGDPFQSTFRPQETLTAQVLAGAVAALNGFGADAVIQGGDLIDNAQSNELALALRVLRGGVVKRRARYVGVQLAGNPDPFYYRPDLDAPRHPGLLSRSTAPFAGPGVRRAPIYPVLGDHDILVQGEIPPSAETQSLAVGDEAVWELPPGLSLPHDLTTAASPDGPPDQRLVNTFLAQALAGPKVRVPPDAARREVRATEAVARLRRNAGATLDYHVDVGANLRLVVLDLARRAGGSGGLVRAGQPQWLAEQLRAAGDRWVIVVSHQPITSSEGGELLLAVLDQHPNVVAGLAGHTHRNEIQPRLTAAGGYWLITTASLIDYPQQARAVRLVETRGGGVAVQTWMLDHAGGDLGRVSRQLAYLDAQGGRPRHFAGTRADRNAILYRQTG